MEPSPGVRGRVLGRGRNADCSAPHRSLDRNAARATFGVGGKSTDFSVGFSPTPITHVSASPRCHPWRSDSPSPVGDHGIFPNSLPPTTEA